MPDRTDLWYRLGYAIESARHGQARAAPLAADRRRRAPVKDERSRDPEPAHGAEGALDLLLTVGAGSLMGRLLALWPGRPAPSASRLVRAAAAGAGAIALRELIRLLPPGRAADADVDGVSIDRLVAGVTRGLLHASVVAPRLPGPPALRGAGHGVLEYLLSPWGGLRGVARQHAPWRRLPLVASLLDQLDGGDESLVDHLVFGVMLGVLYGEDDDEARIGIGIDER